MRRVLIAVLMSLGLLAGCEGEPVYRGVSFIAYNYTQYDLDSVSLTDASGQRAVTMQVSVGGGEGSVSCCYTLKGTEFNAQWRAVDGEVLYANLDKGNTERFFFTREKPVSFPPSEVPPGDGPLYLEMHIYPDEHVELALTRKLLGQTRIDIAEATRWLWANHRDALSQYRDVYELLRVMGRVTKTSWGKYRIEEQGDMQQYMRLYFTVASDFDKDPGIKAVLEKSDRKPGEFARMAQSLSAQRIAAIKQAGTPPGDKNG